MREEPAARITVFIPSKSLSGSGTSLSSTAGLTLSSRHVVVDNHLPVLRRANLRPGGVVPRGGFGVHVDDLPVSLVLEQQTRFAVGDDLFGLLHDFVVQSVKGDGRPSCCKLGVRGT